MVKTTTEVTTATTGLPCKDYTMYTSSDLVMALFLGVILAIGSQLLIESVFRIRK